MKPLMKNERVHHDCGETMYFVGTSADLHNTIYYCTECNNFYIVSLKYADYTTGECELIFKEISNQSLRNEYAEQLEEIAYKTRW